MAVLNVKDYGATGDGVTNDTTAFLNALSDLENVYEKGYLYCPSGTYVINQQLEITKPYVGIRGDGIQATKLQFADSGLLLSSYNDTSLATIENLTLSGPGHSAAGVYANTGIYMPTSNYYFLSRFGIVNFDTGVSTDTAVLNKFEDFCIEGCKIGMQFGNGSYMNTLLNGVVRGCQEVGVYETGSRLIIKMSDFEVIGVYNETTHKYEGGIAVKTGTNTEIADCHFEQSEICIGLAGAGHVAVADCYIGGCDYGVKQVAAGLAGTYNFENLRIAGAVTEFDIPDTYVYKIDNCTAFFSNGAGKGLTINASATSGTITGLEYSPQGFWLSGKAAGMRINGRDVLVAHKFSESIAVGNVAANTTVEIEVTTPSGIQVDQWGGVVQAAIITYSMPAGLLLATSIKLDTYDKILLQLTNTTGADINMGTQMFRFNLIAA